MFEQMLFIGLNTKDYTVIKRLIKEYHVGGLILYSKNYNNYREMINLINQIHSWAKEENYIILTAIDQEGFRVNRLPKEITNLKSPYAFRNSIDDIKEHANIISDILNKSNININFAPVLDIKRFKDNHAIGDRCFGDDANLVIKNTIPYLKILQEKRVIPVAKHFPGHGLTKLNSHYFIPKKLFMEDIKPFVAAINNGIDIIMVGHFIIPKFSLFTPISFSKNTVLYLRKKLNFSAIIMTDDLIMGPLKFFNKAKLIKKAVNSGINLIMIKYYDGLFKDIDKLKSDKNLNKDNINYSIQLKNKLIKKYYITNDLIINSLNIESINKRINNLNSHIK